MKNEATTRRGKELERGKRMHRSNIATFHLTHHDDDDPHTLSHSVLMQSAFLSPLSPVSFGIHDDGADRKEGLREESSALGSDGISLPSLTLTHTHSSSTQKCGIAVHAYCSRQKSVCCLSLFHTVFPFFHVGDSLIFHAPRSCHSFPPILMLLSCMWLGQRSGEKQRDGKVEVERQQRERDC